MLDYRFAFTKLGRGGKIYANIIPGNGAEVWGVAYLCNPEAIQKMDRYEGVASGDYERIPVTVFEQQSGKKVEAITYVAGQGFECDPGKPSPEYLLKIVSGARHHKLPEEYIAQVESLAK